MEADEIWSIATPEAVSLRCWPDGCVFFDARESRTLMLSCAAGEILASLRESPATAGELCARLDRSGLDAHSMSDMLSGLAEHGIVRPLN